MMLADSMSRQPCSNAEDLEFDGQISHDVQFSTERMRQYISLGYIRFYPKKLQQNVCHVDNLCKIVVHNILKIGDNRTSDYC